MILVLCSKYGRAKNNCRKLSWKSFAIDWSPHKHRAYFCLSLFWISREAHWTRTPGSNTTPFQTCINIIALVVLVFFLSFFFVLPSCVRLFATSWTAALQPPLSIEFSRQESQSGLPVSTPGDLPDPGINSTPPALAGGLFTTVPPGKPN